MELGAHSVTFLRGGGSDEAGGLGEGTSIFVRLTSVCLVRQLSKR